MLSVLGFAAGILTAFAFLPQVARTWRTRSAADLSLGMLWAQSVGVALWIAYGVGIRSVPVILANSITLAFSGTLLLFKYRFR